MISIHISAQGTGPLVKVEIMKNDLNNAMFGLMSENKPGGKSLIYYTQPGVEGEIFGMQTAYSTLKAGGTCVFITSSSSPGIIKSQFREIGLDIEQFNNRLFFVDAYSQLTGEPSREKYVVPAPDNIYNLNNAIISLLLDSPPGTFVFGSLSTIMDLCGENETIEAVRIWNKLATQYGHTLVYNFTAWPYSREVLNSIKEDLFNTVICIGGMTRSMIFGKYAGKFRSDWIMQSI